MKCRRSKNSRGARLRGSTASPTTQSVARARAKAPAAVGAGTSTGAGASPSLLRIDGPSKGSVEHNGTVIVGRKGAVTGNLSATIVVVEGQVEGDLQATLALRIAATARIAGDLAAPRVAVAKGASVRGRITTQRPSAAAAARKELEDSAVDALLAGA